MRRPTVSSGSLIPPVVKCSPKPGFEQSSGRPACKCRTTQADRVFITTKGTDVLHCKTIEVRDRGTFIPCCAILVDPAAVARGQDADRYLLRRAGWAENEPNIILVRLEGRGRPAAAGDAYDWPENGGRTMRLAHEHVRDN